METTVQSIKTSLSIGDSVTTSLIGFSIVFFVLIALMVVIRILRSVVDSLGATSPAPAPEAPIHAGHLAPEMVPATGSLGEVKLHDVDDRTAAMLMAIVADELQAPLNELRFLSIREKK